MPFPLSRPLPRVRRPMRPPGLTLSFALVGALALTFAPAGAQELDVTTADYNRAERFLNWHTETMVSGDEVDPEWLENGSSFWYRNRLGEGHEFIFVDPGTATRRALFVEHLLGAEPPKEYEITRPEN